MKFIHLTDTHILGRDEPSLYGLNPDIMLKRAIKSIKKMHKDAEFIVITGDISDNGKKLSYKKLKTLTKKTKIEILPILGNHDCRENFAYYFPEFLNDGFIQYSRKIGNKAFIFLDTLSNGNPYGELCSSRLNWLERELKKYKSEHIYIFMHHHPIECGLNIMDTKANFKTKTAFWEIINKFKNVRHITFGHVHAIFHASKDGVSMHSTRSTTFQVAYLPTKVHEYLTNEEPTYAIIRVFDDGDTTIRHHQFLTEERVFSGRN